MDFFLLQYLDLQHSIGTHRKDQKTDDFFRGNAYDHSVYQYLFAVCDGNSILCLWSDYGGMHLFTAVCFFREQQMANDPVFPVAFFINGFFRIYQRRNGVLDHAV